MGPTAVSETSSVNSLRTRCKNPKTKNITFIIYRRKERTTNKGKQIISKGDEHVTNGEEEKRSKKARQFGVWRWQFVSTEYELHV
jgi:hypothetical protein